MKLFLLCCVLMGVQGEQGRIALAHEGHIESSAPVQNESRIVIAAPRERVWNLLASVNAWPAWEKEVESVEAPQELREGTDFVWKTNGTKIRSHIALIQKPAMLAWTGTASTAHAVHVWELQSLPDGKTLVITRESMSGFLVSTFYPSARLRQTHESWLQALKTAAER